MSLKTSAAYFVTFILAIVMVGSPYRHRASRAAGAVNPPESSDLVALRKEGNQYYNRGQYRRAARLYEQGLALAQRRGELGSAVRFLNNLGSARYQVFQYRQAVKAYLEAKDLAKQSGDPETFGALCLNLSSLYLQMGDSEAAAQSAQQGVDAVAGLPAPFRPRLLIQSALVRARQKDPAAAIALLRSAIAEARQGGDTSSEAQASNELGNVLRDSGNSTNAEPALREALRLRTAAHDDRIYYTYEALGKLYMSRGDPRTAAAFFTRALESARRISPTAMWTSYHERGKARLTQGRLEDAFGDFRSALNWLRRWRAEVLPADAFRISAEVELHDIYASYIAAADRLYLQTRRRRFAEAAFAATEENRASSLRALWTGSDGLMQILPAEYWETLSQLHAAETATLMNESASNVAAVQQLRLRLSELETHAGVELPPPTTDTAGGAGSMLERIRGALRGQEVYLGFLLGDAESWLWVVAREGIELRTLPPRAKIAKRAADFARAVRDGLPEAAALGQQLYGQLFGSCSPRLLDKRVWLLGLDDSLFDMPLAALVSGYDQSGAPVYVVERHALEVAPAILGRLGRPLPAARGPFVALGDPIYNAIDDRLPHSAPRAAVAAPLQLARLVRSEREIENCARIWRARGVPARVLTGAAASRGNLLAALRQNPLVLHLSTHIVTPEGVSGRALVALTGSRRGEVEFLSASDIASMRVRLGLVVMNGCSSAAGDILPGAGLIGLTRAWLAAGAEAVIGAIWPVPDDEDQEFFQHFYENLAPSDPTRSFAVALQQAQISELRGRRARPAHWSTYLYLARN